MINKELLSKVLDINLKDNVCVVVDNEIHISFEDRVDKINIYELAHKCKEWIIDMEQNQGICTHKTFYTQTDGYEWYCGFASIQTTYDDEAILKDISKADTEVEAIFKATQWILDNKDK